MPGGAVSQQGPLVGPMMSAAGSVAAGGGHMMAAGGPRMAVSMQQQQHMVSVLETVFLSFIHYRI